MHMLPVPIPKEIQHQNSVKRISMTLTCSLLNAERAWLMQNFDKSKLHFIEQIYPLI